MELRVLAVGDIVGEGGQDILRRRLRELRSRSDIHFTVVNGENASGVGITPAQARGMLDAGADVITLGNHTWNRIQIGDFLDKSSSILRPANYAGRVPGRGYGIYQCRGVTVGVINLMGRVDLNPNLDSPFKLANTILRQMESCDVILLDFHAEATSEKGAMAWHPHPCAHRRLPGAAPGHRLRHRPGHDRPQPLGAGHQAGELHQPVPGGTAPAV